MTEDQLELIMKRCLEAQKGDWKAYIEGRDHESRSSFIMTGTGQERGEDLEISGATSADLEFIAHAKQDIPLLIDEVRRVKDLLRKLT